MTQKTTTCGRRSSPSLKGVWGVAVVVISGCGSLDRLPAIDLIPTSVLKVETSVHRRLVENSVAVTSVSQPGIIFGLNDSGNGPYLFAFDSGGVGRGVWEVVGAQNRDWEAAAIGPCHGSSQASCIYVGDVGANEAKKSRLTVYRFPEPRVPDSGNFIPAAPLPVHQVARLDFVYSDRPHDVEAMYVGRDGSVFFITKRRLLDAEQRPRPALVFRISSSAWDS